MISLSYRNLKLSKKISLCNLQKQENLLKYLIYYFKQKNNIYLKMIEVFFYVPTKIKCM